MITLLAMNPVLLVHGIDDTSATFRTMRPRLEAKGWKTDAVDLLPSNGDRSLAELGAQVRDRAEALRARTGSQQIDIVSFSLGGIVTRYYLQRLNGSEAVKRFVTISSPHQGTYTGFLRWNRGGEELRPQSAFITDLNRDWSSHVAKMQVTSIWTPFDLVIMPANSSQLPGAKDVTVPVLVHPWMLWDSRSLEAVEAALQAEP